MQIGPITKQGSLKTWHHMPFHRHPLLWWCKAYSRYFNFRQAFLECFCVVQMWSLWSSWPLTCAWPCDSATAAFSMACFAVVDFGCVLLSQQLHQQEQGWQKLFFPKYVFFGDGRGLYINVLLGHMLQNSFKASFDLDGNVQNLGSSVIFLIPFVGGQRRGGEESPERASDSLEGYPVGVARGWYWPGWKWERWRERWALQLASRAFSIASARLNM